MHYHLQIRKARKKQKLLQKQVAAMVGITWTQYQRIESGKGTNTQTLEKICKALNITIIFPEL